MQTRERAHPPTRVVHCKREPYDVYVGRGGPWGNAYSHSVNSAAQHLVGSREEAVAAFERDLLADPDRVALVRSELRGKVLGCWCEPKLCHGRVLARVADSDGPIEPAFQLDPALGPSIEVDPDPLDTLPPIDARELFGDRRVVCLDVETDARYSDLGVGRLVCMAYSFDGKHTHTVDADTAVELFREWIIDDDLLLFGQSVYSDLAVLAQASFRKATGFDCIPGTEWAYELVHRAYDAGRIVDTEIRTRLTYIRFGPHKAAPGLGATVKQFFGIDIADAKTLGKKDKEETSALLTSARPWEEWPRELFDRIPWRFKYGSLIDVPLKEWPKGARDYVADDVRWPWHVYRRQQQLWTASGVSAIPDERRQTSAAWHLHLLAIPGWLADRERAQRIREIYRKVVAHCERTLVQAGIVEITPSVLKIDDARVRELIVDALGEKARLPDTYAKSNPNPTIEQLRAHCSTDAHAIKSALAVVDCKPIKLDSKVHERNLVAVIDAVAELDAGTLLPLQTLGLWKAREKLPEIVGDVLACRAVDLATTMLVNAGLLAWTTKTRTTKKQRISQRVFVALGADTPLTKKAAKLYSFPTLEQREQFASSDKKAVREAVLESGAMPLNVVDAVDRADASAEEFDAWLAESRAPELNAYALRSLASKTITSFLDKLDVSTRIRTTYQTVIESGRTSCLAGWVLIRTSTGLRPISELRVGDQVWTHQNRWRRVSAIWTKGVQPMTHLYLSNGELLTCTGAHKLLLSDGTWTPTNDLLARLDRQYRKSNESVDAVSDRASLADTGYSETSRDNHRQCGLRHANVSTCGGAQTFGCTSLRASKNRDKESDVWKDSGETPQLGRGVRERSGLLDHTAQRQTTVGTQGRNGECSRGGRDSEKSTRAPHRQEYAKQLAQQFGPRERGRAQVVAQSSQGVRVYAQEVAGSHLVYDITVEDDASYEACGVFHHNSRNLNIQQFPRDNGKPGHLHIRGCILPDPGWVFVVADYSQLELCALAHVLTELVRFYARNPARRAHAERMLGHSIDETYTSTLARAINEGKDCHLLMAGTLLGKSYEYCVSLYESAEAKKKAKQSLTPEESEVVEARQLSKACNFGFPGGLGAKKFIDYAAAYGVPITLDRAEFAKRSYMLAWPEMKLYFDFVAKKCEAAGPRGAVCRQLGSGRLRGDCNFNQFANSPFQGLASDGAKEALASLINASYRDVSSPLFGCRPSAFVHDEFLISCPAHLAERALPEVERLMVEAMQRWIPNILIQAPGRIMKERWSK